MDICRRRNVSASELFWRGIFGGTDPDRLAVDDGHPIWHKRHADGLREPQVDDHRLTSLAKEDVRRLEIAMDDTS